MSKSAKSMFVFAIYLFFLGPALLAFPKFLLSLIGMNEPLDFWVRITGMLVLILAYYYLQAAKHDLKPFFKATVYGRFSVLVFCIAFVVLDYAPPLLLLFPVIDVSGAIWTAIALKKEKQ